MTDKADITDRLRTASATLDQAIERYAAGDVRFDPAISTHLLTKVAAGAILTGGVVAVPMFAARTGDDGHGAPAQSPAQSVATVPIATAAALPAGAPTLPGDGETFTDEEAWETIDWLFALAPYGADGDRYHHLIIQDQLEKCMNERGFEYHQYPFTPSRAGGDGYVLVPPLPTEADVEVAGYAAFRDPGGTTIAGPPTSDEVVATTDPALIDATAANDELRDEPEWMLALYGDETKVGTCTGEAWGFVEERVGTEARERYSALSSTMTMLTNPIEYPGDVLADTMEQWRTCMGALGVEAQNPFGARDLYVRQPGVQPSDEEIAAALDDLRCRKSSGFRDAYRDAVAAAIVNFRYENQSRIDDLVAATRRETEALRDLATELGLIDADPSH